MTDLDLATRPPRNVSEKYGNARKGARAAPFAEGFALSPRAGVGETSKIVYVQILMREQCDRMTAAFALLRRSSSSIRSGCGRHLIHKAHFAGSMGRVPHG
jgi:hypothetical protein